MLPAILGALAFLLFVTWYLMKLNRLLVETPSEIKKFASKDWTTKMLDDGYARAKEDPIDITASLGKRTGHRYIVVGGNGSLGSLS
jgi:hypothetical protein